MSIWSKLFRSSEPPSAPASDPGASAGTEEAVDDTKATLHDSPSKTMPSTPSVDAVAEGPPTRPQAALNAAGQTQIGRGTAAPAPMPTPATGATKLRGRRTLRGDIGEHVTGSPSAKAKPEGSGTRPQRNAPKPRSSVANAPPKPKKTMAMGAMAAAPDAAGTRPLKRGGPRAPAPTGTVRAQSPTHPEPELENPLPQDSGPDFEMQFQASPGVSTKQDRAAAIPKPKNGAIAPTRKAKKGAKGESKKAERAPGQLANSVLDALVGEESGQDSLESEVDALFDAATSQGGGEAALKDQARPDDLHEMFEQMVAMHLRPVRDLMLELRWGSAPSSWIAHCRVALRTVQDAAAELDRPDLQAQLDKLAGALDAASKDGRAEISKVFKSSLLGAYEPIAKLAPKELSLEDEFGRREPVLVRSVLLQAQDVEHVTLGKLFGAGLSTMQGLLAANSEDVSMTANVPALLSDRIVRRVDEYKDKFGTTTASVDREIEVGRLRDVLRELEKTQDQYDTASRGWSDEAVREKRRLQKERGRMLLRVSVIMARMGETDLLNELERTPIETRIKKLSEYVGGQAGSPRTNPAR